tara:strand:- start:3063 stop:3188 length:126 start_codon:yes stop_codon:yes gene_type:complete
MKTNKDLTKEEAKSLCTINILDEVVQHDLAVIQYVKGKKFN